MFEALRIIETFKPEVAIAENVVYLISKKFKSSFDLILDELDKIGYNNYWTTFSGLDFNIPQTRNRLFIVSIKKDIDNGFNFPNPIELTKSVSDFLEPQPKEKYLKSKEWVIRERANKFGACSNRVKNINLPAATLTANGHTGCCVFEDGSGRLFSPKEYFRLMGFDDIDVDLLIENGFSDYRLYKLAGNSIIVNILEEIFKSIYKGK